MEFKDKKILIFYPYGCTKHYGDSICQELRRRGAIVYGYDERPSQSAWFKIIIRLLKKKIPQIFINYLRKTIRTLEGIEIDYVLVIRGEAFTTEAVKYLREQIPNAYFILYLWDILKVNNLVEASKLYDKVLTFDEEDSKKNPHMLYRPTFFPPEYVYIANSKKNEYTSDILFIGTLNPYRYNIFKSIDEKLKGNFTFAKYLYIPSRVVLLKDRLKDKTYAKDYEYHFQPISLKDSISEIAKTKSIIDITYLSGGQCGMSMRAYEALASNRKYITSNSNIVNYDFYNTTNILIVDPKNPVIPNEFLENDFEPIPTAILNKYSIATWVDEVFINV